ncbi:MAG TPA: hypothetical protein VMY69_08055 [Phycisphaerae bacterium]|nr:hypothetical protein [Phycisphaerae bacterium]
MSTEKALAKTDETAGLMPALSSEQAVGRYNEIVAFVKKVMKPNIDFGVIPGTRGKPTLLKPGAEKLCSLFGLDCTFELANSIEDWENGFFDYRYRAVLRRGERVVAAAEGSCNSKESKYRWRWVPMAEKPCDEAAEEMKAQGLLRWRKRDGAWCAHERLKNDDIFSQVNTLQKMAQKRALVASILIAANASEFFTQDIEDMETIDAEVVEVVEEGQGDSPPQSSRSSKPKSDNKPGNAKPGQPTNYAAKDTPAQAAMRKDVFGAIMLATQGESATDRAAWLESLTGFTPTKGDRKGQRVAGVTRIEHLSPAKPGAKTGRLEILHGKIKKGEIDAATYAEWKAKRAAEAAIAAQDAAAEAPQEDPGDPLAPTEGEDSEDVIPF